MLSSVRKVATLGTSLLLFAAPAKPANNAEQVVFSTPGFLMELSGNSKGGTTPFGFWIWCAAEAAAPSNGGYQRDNVCQGSMYFYALDKHAEHVVGLVSEDPFIEGKYTMDVIEGTANEVLHGTPNPSFHCTLTNEPSDASGPGKAVEVTCQFFDPSLGGGTGSAVVTNSVVNVTGP